MADVYLNGIKKTNSLNNFYKHSEGEAESDENSGLEQREGNESPTFQGNSTYQGGQSELPNEISAPYEVPQFPIEQIEKKLFIQRQLNYKQLEDKRSHYEPSVKGPEEVDELDDNDLYVPHFQRVSISGEDTSGVPLEDLERASKLIIQALEIRKRYMEMSFQNFSSTAARFLDPNKAQEHHDEKQSIEDREYAELLLRTSRASFDDSILKILTIENVETILKGGPGNS